MIEGVNNKDVWKMEWHWSQGIRQMIDLLSEESRIDSTAIQTVGRKGYDGFVLGIVK